MEELMGDASAVSLSLLRKPEFTAGDVIVNEKTILGLFFGDYNKTETRFIDYNEFEEISVLYVSYDSNEYVSFAVSTERVEYLADIDCFNEDLEEAHLTISRNGRDLVVNHWFVESASVMDHITAAAQMYD